MGTLQQQYKNNPVLFGFSTKKEKLDVCVCAFAE
jgi:hypothetical protein